MDNEFCVNINISILWDISDSGLVDSVCMILFIHYYDLLKSNNCSNESTPPQAAGSGYPKKH
jgi:ABC-type transporter Mla MlaB component